MDLIIDASSIINLANAGALSTVATLAGRTICVSPLVVLECEPTCAAELLQLQHAGLIKFVDPDEISADAFLDLLDRHDLGEGETECLALLQGSAMVFCCDDGRARNVGIGMVGAERVVGSLRLLKWSVSEGIMSGDEAFSFYETMKAAGGFLPDIAREWFNVDAPDHVV